MLEGSLSVADARTERMRGLLTDFGVKVDAALADSCEKIYREAYDREWRAVPGAPELLRSLREWGIWIGIITNGYWSEQSAKLEELWFEDGVNEPIVRVHVRANKPERESFRLDPAW